MGHRKGNRSAATVAQLLGLEGYSDYVHNQVKRYWKRIIMRGGTRRVRRLEQDFSEFMADATDAERLIVGKFISQRAKESFDTGLRIGLMAHAHQNDKESAWMFGAADDRRKE